MAIIFKKLNSKEQLENPYILYLLLLTFDEERLQKVKNLNIELKKSIEMLGLLASLTKVLALFTFVVKTNKYATDL